MGPVEGLRTEHLLLRRPVPEDVADLVVLHLDEQVMATLGGVRTPEQTREYHQQMLDHWQQHGFGLWIACDLETGRFAGRGGLRHTEFDGRDEVEVAYTLAREFWGRGLATEMAAESVRVAFEELRLADLVCYTLTTHLASRRVMEKVGFRFERHGERDGHPLVFYRLKREQI